MSILSKHTLKDSADQVILRLYVAGNSPNSVHARANLSHVLDEHADTVVHTEVIDVLVDGKAALQDGVLLTPTLVRLSPKPVMRLIGDLSDHVLVEQLLNA
jgi:circadian clock protein KaiB